MSRKQVDVCMICDKNPCACSSRRKSYTKRTFPDKPDASLERPVTPHEERSGPSVRDLMKLRASEKQPAIPVRIKRDVPVRSKDELELERAVKLLAPILHDEELERFSHIINREVFETRARDLKRRHDGTVAGHNEERPVRASGS